MPDLAHITQEKIINSDQLLTVIPFSTNNDIQKDRILLTKIENEIKSVVFSMYPDKDIISKNFSGKIMIRNLDGDFVNGFRVKDGNIVSQFIKTTKTTKSNTNKTAGDFCECEELNEVIIINRYSKSYSLERCIVYRPAKKRDKKKMPTEASGPSVQQKVKPFARANGFF